MLSRRRTIRLAVAGALLVVSVVGMIVALTRSPRVHGPPRPHRGMARAPEGVRIKVQVLNATQTRGLGRLATLYLRDQGFDVVALGTSLTPSDTVVVIDHSGHPEWARLVGEALGGARLEARPDTSRYLDVTVLVGASWRPPSEALYP